MKAKGLSQQHFYLTLMSESTKLLSEVETATLPFLNLAQTTKELTTAKWWISSSPGRMGAHGKLYGQTQQNQVNFCTSAKHQVISIKEAMPKVRIQSNVFQKTPGKGTCTGLQCKHTQPLYVSRLT